MTDAAVAGKVLALDTSGETCSVAVQAGAELTICSELMPRRHNQELIPMLRRVCERAGVAFSDLQLIGYVAGPGSFTGLRIGVGLVQGLAYGLRIPTVAVSALAALAAEAAPTDSCILAVQHARADELFAGFYRSVAARPGGVELLDRERLCTLDNIRLPDGVAAYSGAGGAWRDERLRSALLARLGKPERLLARADPDIRRVMRLTIELAAVGAAQSALATAPGYLREDVAQPSAGR